VRGQADAVKLIDFGASKANWSAGLSVQGQLIGTPYYMAPEQAQGEAEEVGACADQFALAMMTYEMLSGKLPFTDQDPMSVLYRIVNEDLPPLQESLRWTPTAVEPVLRRGLRKDPHGRYASVQEFSDALDEALYHDIGGAPEPLRLLRRSETPSRSETFARAWAATLEPTNDGAAGTAGDDLDAAPPDPNDASDISFPEPRHTLDTITASDRAGTATASAHPAPGDRTRRRSGRGQKMLAAVVVAAALLGFSRRAQSTMTARQVRDGLQAYAGASGATV
jgi:serine/threonine protein kinase